MSWPPRISRKRLVERDRTGLGFELICPLCEGDNLHQGRVVVFERVDESAGEFSQEPDPAIVTVSGVGTAISADNRGNPSERRDGLRIEMECEGCGKVPDFLILQHKGTTYMRWDYK